jgi:uncharacterized membrane protein
MIVIKRPLLVLFLLYLITVAAYAQRGGGRSSGGRSRSYSSRSYGGRSRSFFFGGSSGNGTSSNTSGWWTVIIIAIVGAAYAGPIIKNYVTEGNIGSLFDNRKKKIRRVTDEYEAKSEGNPCEMS